MTSQAFIAITEMRTRLQFAGLAESLKFDRPARAGRVAVRRSSVHFRDMASTAGMALASESGGCGADR